MQIKYMGFLYFSCGVPLHGQNSLDETFIIRMQMKKAVLLKVESVAYKRQQSNHDNSMVV